ncbi:hypothetical protein ACFOLK_16575 [Marinococcus halophilus]|uniref:hypothetical protein n=1 Tax=Marinococcus halophilus TaxID=1371 RepID=UPI00361C33B3
MIALIMAALAPAVALLLYFTLKRRADVERRLPVIRAFVIGVLIVFPVLVIEHALETEGVGMPLFAAVKRQLEKRLLYEEQFDRRLGVEDSRYFR